MAMTTAGLSMACPAVGGHITLFQPLHTINIIIILLRDHNTSNVSQLSFFFCCCWLNGRYIKGGGKFMLLLLVCVFPLGNIVVRPSRR